MISDIAPDDVFETDQVENWIEEFKFIVFKGFGKDIATVQQWIGRHGELVRNEKRVNDNVLVLDGSDAREVLKGKGRMPLHCDGLLMNESIRLVCIYGVDFELEAGGRTCITDNETGWDRIPDRIRSAFAENGIEILPCDTSYYIKNEPEWYRFPGIQSRAGRDYINAGLHYHHDEQPSYRIRLAGIPDETSYEYYNTIESIYCDDSMIYYHDWEPGDLLLMDNVRTMHGREAFEGKRSIIQFQVRN